MAIQGNTPEEKFASVDSILSGLRNKVDLWNKKFGKKESIPFQVGGQAQACASGEAVFAFMSLLNLDLKNMVIMVDEFPEEETLHAVLMVISDKGEERAQKYRIKQGANCIKQDWKINAGDRVAVLISYKDQGPKGVWATIRGDQR